MRRLLPLVVIGLVIGWAAPAVAESSHLKGVTETILAFAPTCEVDGPVYEITLTYNSVLSPGGFTYAGTFVGVPLDASEPSFSGRFASSNGFHGDFGGKINSRYIFNVTGAFDDGTRFNTHVSEHFNALPTGAEIFSRHCHD